MVCARQNENRGLIVSDIVLERRIGELGELAFAVVAVCGEAPTLSAPDDQIPFIHVDLRGIPQAQQANTLEAVAANLQASLDLTTGPILRVALFELGPDEEGTIGLSLWLDPEQYDPDAIYTGTLDVTGGAGLQAEVQVRIVVSPVAPDNPSTQLPS